MARTFDVYLPLETAYVRKVLFAAECIDAITLARIHDGLDVTATGLEGAPIVNGSGMFVWLVEGNRQPQEVVVDPGGLPYESVRIAVPPPPPPPARPQRLVSVVLMPRRNYPFTAGVAGVRSTLVALRNQDPPVPVPDTEVWLRWIDDQAPGTAWTDAPTRTRTDANGDFVALLLLSPAQAARVNAGGGYDVRLCLTSGIDTLKYEFSLPQGRVFDPPRPFARDEFTP